MTDKILKMVSIILAIVLMPVIFAGCNSPISTEQRRLAREGEREAGTITLIHLENKYGIKASIDNAWANYSGGNFDSGRMYTGQVNVIAKYNSETIYVHVNDGGYMDVPLCGDYFVDDVMGGSYDYITFVGKK